MLVIVVLAAGRALEAGATLRALQAMARGGRAAGVGGVGAAVGRGRGLRRHAFATLVSGWADVAGSEAVAGSLVVGVGGGGGGGRRNSALKVL